MGAELRLNGRSILLITCWALLAWSPLAAIRLMGSPYFFNADALYLPALFHDLFFDGGSFGDWQLTPAPYFFPDMPLYFAVATVFRNLGSAIAAFAVVQTLLLGGSLYFLARITIPGSPRSLGALSALLASALLWASRTGHLDALFLSLLSAIHFGNVLTQFVSLGVFLLLARRGSRALAVCFALLCFAGSASDPLFLIVSSIPLLALTAVIALLERRGARWLRDLAGLIAIPSGLGFGVVLAVTSRRAASGYATPRTGHRVHQQWIHFRELWSERWLHQPVATLLWGLGLLVALALVTWGLRQRRLDAITSLAAFTLLTIVVNFSTLFFNGTPDVLAWTRYSQGSTLLPLVLLALTLMRALGGTAQLATTAIFAVLLCGAWGSALQWRFLPVSGLSEFHLPLVDCLDANQAALHLTRGVSGYWQAKPVSLISHRGIKVVQLSEQLLPDPWINNARWYLESGDARPYNFAVVTGLDRSLFVQTYGEPQNVLRCDGAEVLIYAPSSHFDSRLRAALSTVLRPPP